MRLFDSYGWEAVEKDNASCLIKKGKNYVRIACYGDKKQSCLIDVNNGEGIREMYIFQMFKGSQAMPRPLEADEVKMIINECCNDADFYMFRIVIPMNHTWQSEEQFMDRLWLFNDLGFTLMMIKGIPCCVRICAVEKNMFIPFTEGDLEILYGLLGTYGKYEICETEYMNTEIDRAYKEALFENGHNLQKSNLRRATVICSYINSLRKTDNFELSNEVNEAWQVVKNNPACRRFVF